MKFLYPVLILFILSFTSCQSDSKAAQNEDKKTTFANFYLRYLQQERKVKGEAFFRKGENAKIGSAIEYEKGVSFDGVNMNMKKAVGRKLYRFEQNDEFKSQYKFVINPDGKDNYNYTLSINPISSFKIDKANLATGIELSWDGSNLSKDEELVLLFTDKDNKAFSIDVKGPTTSPSVAIGKEKLGKMNAGKGALYLVRKLKTEEKKSGVHFNAISEFYTKSIEVEIE